MAEESQLPPSQEATEPSYRPFIGGVGGVAAVGLSSLIDILLPNVSELVAAGLAAYVIDSLFVLLAAGFAWLLYWGMSQIKGTRKWAKNVAICLLVATILVAALLDLFFSGKTFRLESNLGWQDTGFIVGSNSDITIDVTGQISLALNQEYHLAELAKPFVVYGDGNLPQFEKIYPWRPITAENRFNRSWVSARGDDGRTDMLDDLKVDPDENWGVVLCTVQAARDIPSNVEIDRLDPWSKLLNVREQDIRAFTPDRHRDSFARSGHLFCMVNDGVISPDSRNQRDASARYYQALANKKLKDRLDSNHEIKPQDIPFVFLNDNAGQFTLKIYREWRPL